MDKQKRQEKNENFKAVANAYFSKKDLFLIPNILCYIRLILTVVFLILYILSVKTEDAEASKNLFIMAAVSLAVGASTDCFDGLIARKFNMVSNWGKFIDPVADKILQLAIGIAILVRLYKFKIVFVMFGIFVVKEITLFFESFFLARNNRAFNGAKWFGKVSTVIFYFVTLALLILAFLQNMIGLSEDTFGIITTISCSFVIAGLSLSWVMYSIQCYTLYKKGEDVVKKNEEGKQ